MKLVIFEIVMKTNRILVVDDDKDIRELMALILEDNGYTVKLQANGLHTFENIAAFKPDLIILDVMLSGMDGREICNSLKSTDMTSHIPVIMVSASHNLQSSSQDCMADVYIEKPFDLWSFLSKVEKKLVA